MIETRDLVKMRIIGGKLKRRKIKYPKTKLTRPVTDRAKETIFNVLNGSFESSTVLDLFAGSGSLGLEALSRGAIQACFVDSERFATRCINSNLEDLRLEGKSQVLQMPVPRAIRWLEKRGKSFNRIFLDPPHNKGLTKKTLHQLDDSVTVQAFGILIVGHSNKESLPSDLKHLQLKRCIPIGQTFVSILTKAGV